VPDRLAGSVLVPLNELETVDRDAWHRAREKYAGREQVLELRIPPLGCRWNDALHLSTVHPADLAAALEAAGLERPQSKFYEIDAADLEPERVAVFLNRRGSRSLVDPSEWVPFAPSVLTALAAVNDETRSYYRECARDGTRPLVWARLPHVLYRGTLDTRRLKVVDASPERLRPT
jgi:hypothetical protein